MTNIVAAVITTVVTNWASIGTFTPSQGYPQYDVQDGCLQTNTVAIIEYKEQRHELILEICKGPKVSERRIEKPPSPNFQPWPLGTWATNNVIYLNTMVSP